MNSQKSKPLEEKIEEKQKMPVFKVLFWKRPEVKMLPFKERQLIEEKQKRRAAVWSKIKRYIGQFFTILFVLAVIFSMIVVPLLLVFG